MTEKLMKGCLARVCAAEAATLLVVTPGVPPVNNSEVDSDLRVADSGPVSVPGRPENPP